MQTLVTPVIKMCERWIFKNVRRNKKQKKDVENKNVDVKVPNKESEHFYILPQSLLYWL